MSPNKQNGGDRGPWGQGRFGGPRSPRDLEELLRRGQSKLKQVLTGGSGFSAPFFFVVAIAMVAIVAFLRSPSALIRMSLASSCTWEGLPDRSRPACIFAFHIRSRKCISRR
jgi:hypothetical protein